MGKISAVLGDTGLSFFGNLSQNSFAYNFLSFLHFISSQFKKMETVINLTSLVLVFEYFFLL